MFVQDIKTFESILVLSPHNFNSPHADCKCKYLFEQLKKNKSNLFCQTELINEFA